MDRSTKESVVKWMIRKFNGKALSQYSYEGFYEAAMKKYGITRQEAEYCKKICLRRLTGIGTAK